MRFPCSAVNPVSPVEEKIAERIHRLGTPDRKAYNAKEARAAAAHSSIPLRPAFSVPVLVRVGSFIYLLHYMQGLCA